LVIKHNYDIIALNKAQQIRKEDTTMVKSEQELTGDSEELPRIIVSSPLFREDLRGNVVILTGGGAGVEDEEVMPIGATEGELEEIIERVEASGEEFKPFALIEGEVVDMPESLFEFTSKDPERILEDDPEAEVLDFELRVIPVKRLLRRLEKRKNR